MENLSLDIRFDAWQMGIRETFMKSGFPWHLKVEIPGIQGADEPGPPGFKPPPATSPMDSARRLIEAGAYKEALEILGRVIKEEPACIEAAEWIGKLSNWLHIQEEITIKIDAKDYEMAVERLNTLTLDMPAGAGKEEVMRGLEELKLKWSNEIEILRAELNKVKDLKRKNLILEQLREISPLSEKVEISNEIEDNNRRIEKIRENRRRLRTLFSTILIGGAGMVAIALVFLLTVLPGLKCRHYYNVIEEKMAADPQAALQLIENIKDGCDAGKTIALSEKAHYQVRFNESETLFKNAFALADEHEFEKSLGITDKIKDIWMGLPLPAPLKEKERKLKDMAAAYYLQRARAESEPGKRFIYYHQALSCSVLSREVQAEIDLYLKNNNKSILRSLVDIAGKELMRLDRDIDCQRVKFLTQLCGKIDPTDPGVITLIERTYRRCR